MGKGLGKPHDLYIRWKTVKVEKTKFDNLLGKLLRAKPEPRKKIKTKGKRGPKTPILSR
jgi:hypothetical protein